TGCQLPAPVSLRHAAGAGSTGETPVGNFASRGELQRIICFQRRDERLLLARPITVDDGEGQNVLYITAGFVERDGFDPHIVGQLCVSLAQPLPYACRASVIGCCRQDAVTGT